MKKVVKFGGSSLASAQQFMKVGKIIEAEGVVLGRPKGRKSSPDKYKLSGKEVLIEELQKQSVSQRKIAKICKVDRNTLSRFLKRQKDGEK